MKRHGVAIFGACVSAAAWLGPAASFAQGFPPTSKLELTGGVVVHGADYISGLGTTSQVVLFHTSPTTIRKNPGRLDFLDLTFSRRRSNMDLLHWRNEAVAGTTGFRRSVTVAFLDAQGATGLTFDLKNVWPSKYAVTSTVSNGVTQETETVTLVFTGSTRTQ